VALTIEPIAAERLEEYASVSMAVHVTSRLDLGAYADGAGLFEMPIQAPYQKDYDAFADNSPLYWAKRFNLDGWAMWLARQEGMIVGAAAVLLEEAAALWDLRVHPAARRRGIGTALLQTAARAVRSKGRDVLQIETQDTNIAACRFYAHAGCTLRAIEYGAYAHVPGLEKEIRLVWELALPHASEASRG
jgi:ribosomal protein S18 acetylase RimI-like enzyme